MISTSIPLHGPFLAPASPRATLVCVGLALVATLLMCCVM